MTSKWRRHVPAGNLASPPWPPNILNLAPPPPQYSKPSYAYVSEVCLDIWQWSDSKGGHVCLVRMDWWLTVLRLLYFKSILVISSRWKGDD